MRTPPVALRALTLVAVLTAAAGACASGSGASEGSSAPVARERMASRQPDVITYDEVVASASSASTAYDLISQLRPNFLQAKGVQSIHGGEMNAPLVYLDRNLLGSISALRDIPVSAIAEVRYFNASSAAMRFGSKETASPAIQVTTRK